MFNKDNPHEVVLQAIRNLFGADVIDDRSSSDRLHLEWDDLERKCRTESGFPASFTVPGVDGGSPDKSGSRANSPTPAGFPKIDADTQRGRDGLRRKVLSDELDTEEKLLVESRVAYGDGAPPPLPDEQKDAQKYANRLAKLRQAVSLHEKNIEALRKELAALK